MKKRIALGIILLCLISSLFFFRQTVVTGFSPETKNIDSVMSFEKTLKTKSVPVSFFQDEPSEIINSFGDTDPDTTHLSETAENVPFQTDAQNITSETDSEKVCSAADSRKNTPGEEYIQPSSPVVTAGETEITVTRQEPMIIHHEAEYITIHHDEILEQIKVVDKDAYDEMVLMCSAYDETVVIKEAYDEQVEIKQSVRKQRCRCGQIFDTVDQVNAHIASYFDTEDEEAHSSSGGITVEEVTRNEIIHHDAETITIHHDAEYTTVHHEEEYHYETVITPAWDEHVLVKEAYDEVINP